MDLGLKGKKALVLASSKGLGKSVAYELAKEGASVMICARTASTLENTQREISKATGSSVYSVVADVATREGRKTLINAVYNDLGQPDIVVTNTGGPPAGSFESHSDEDWERAYRQLLESAVGVLRAVVPGMKENHWGRIISITSQAVRQPVEGLILSNAVRSSVLGLVKTLATELGPYNITVNNVMPGYTRTERLHSLLEQNPGLQNAKKEIPLGRFAAPEEFAAAVAFLASERASYITGVSLPVDGGWIKSV